MHLPFKREVAGRQLTCRRPSRQRVWRWLCTAISALIKGQQRRRIPPMPAFSISRRLVAAIVLATLPIVAAADADGPDFWRVVDAPSGASLILRAGPGPEHRAVGAVGADADGAVNFGCVGALTHAQWQAADAAERDAATAARWCRIGHQRMIGWAPGAHLTEGAGPDRFNAGGRLAALDGSEWLARDFAGAPAEAEAWIAFKGDAATGNAGCNRFSAVVESGAGGIAFPTPIEMTRMACPPDESATEAAMIHALSAAKGKIAHHLLLALFDADGVLLATFSRRDFD
jgi:hypothetical protein